MKNTDKKLSHQEQEIYDEIMDYLRPNIHHIFKDEDRRWFAGIPYFHRGICYVYENKERMLKNIGFKILNDLKKVKHKSLHISFEANCRALCLSFTNNKFVYDNHEKMLDMQCKIGEAFEADFKKKHNHRT